MITNIDDCNNDFSYIHISFDKNRGGEPFIFMESESREIPTQKVFESYTTDLLITILNELYDRLNEFPEENELSIIEFLNKKLMEEILRRFDINKKQSDQRKNLLYQMRLTIAVINKSKENIMKKIKEGGEKDED